VRQRSKYFYPIPKKSLLKRFGPAFKKLNAGYSATILALPHTGRTSHLRFIISQPEVLKQLGVDLDKTKIVFFDIDIITNDYNSFVRELASLLSRGNDQDTNLTDVYLNTKNILSRVKKQTETKRIIFILTLNKSCLSFLSDIDKLMVLIQKTASSQSASILWSIDTCVYRNYLPGHSSSSFLDNVFLFPTFTKEETIHSLKRIALAKSQKLKTSFINAAFKITGGIAGTFYEFLNLARDKKRVESLKEVFYSSPKIKRVLNDLKEELNQDEALFQRLAGQNCLRLVSEYRPQDIVLDGLILATVPTAQEISLIRLFTQNLNRPVTRDQIAEAFWGKATVTRYSDWAIDKAISRLRKKIKSKEYQLITVKGLGYQLVKLL